MKIKQPGLKFRTLLFLALFPGLPMAARAQDNTGYSKIGTTQRTEAALIGTMYDMKQNQQRQPIPMDPRTFLEVLANFLDDGWDEGVISKYYRVSRPLYTNELNFDRFNADIAPKAFGVEKTVQPKMWMAWYKGQVTPPSDGTYRFVGFADNYLAVAINGRTCLVACLSSSPIPLKSWVPPDGQTVTKGNSGIWGRRDQCIAGDWLEFKAGRIYDIDVIFGEVPGGETSCFMGIQKKGQALPPSPGHAGLYDCDPFQLSRSSFSLPTTVPWKGIQ
jgi:hypothetical protein